MAMPLRLEPSENPLITFPDVGHAQSSLASSISGTRADSGREGVALAMLVEAGAVADAGGAVADAGGAAAVASAVAGAGGAAMELGGGSNGGGGCAEGGDFLGPG